MKKLLALVIVGAAAFVAYRHFLSPPKRACAHMASLCGAQARDQDACVQQFVDFERKLGPEPSRKAVACVTEAKSCAEAVGCVAGAGAGALGDALKELLKGAGKAATQ